MVRRPPESPRAATRFPYTTLCRSKRCAAIVEGKIYPAMRRQAAELAAVRPRATHDAGVWRLPKGDEYYAYALRFATTTGRSEEHTSELQSLLRTPYAVFCLKKTNYTTTSPTVH